MARAKAQAPAPIVEKLGETLPAVVAEEAAFNRAQTALIQQTDRYFGFGVEYDEEQIVAVINGAAGQIVMQYAIAGAGLLRLKSRKPHGDFLPFVDLRCGFSADTAQKMMRIAGALLLPNDQPRPALQAIAQGGRGGLTKALAIASLSAAELDTIDAGGEVCGITLDALPLKTVLELRENLQAKDRQLAERGEKINDLAAQLEEADQQIGELRRGTRKALDTTYKTALAECDEQLRKAGTDFQNGLQGVGDLAEGMLDLVVPPHQEDVAKATLVRTAYQTCIAAQQGMLAMIQRMESAFGSYLNSLPTA